ncbi:hypothetical protein OGATHE_001807 [Ogataea polymorpha]|uniref:Uncharacterized protein n=1 Tax=Ogataea polymorpha TaxID=460523 RepID=A0A9P8PLW8_9ASCO|nr:hypothetical protein OGATHE_001807 [Ogataea polymorpha]
MSTNNDWLLPTRNQAWDFNASVLPTNHNWLPENSSSQNVSNGSVWRDPHLLESEFLDTSLVRSDSGALNTNSVLLDGIGSVDSDLVVRFISGQNSQVVVLEVDIEVGQNQFFLDDVPDDSGHFITVQLHYWSLDLDFAQSPGRC